MGFSWLRIIALKAFLTLARFSWVFRGSFVDPLETKLVALSGGFHGLFVDVGAPPTAENIRVLTALENTKENIFLSQVLPL